ncbi:hypothetical protein F5B18DRAFT_613487 [Nemania serpens]|nr:hypothetical protein F5B18DRAFT_613487 [Nemania serpens]
MFYRPTDLKREPPIFNGVEACWMVAKPAMERARGTPVFQDPSVVAAFCHTIVEDSYMDPRDLLPDFQAYCKRVCSEGCVEELSIPGSVHDSGNSDRYAGSMVNVGKKFFALNNGFIGLGPGLLAEGDFCCVLFGSNVPFVVRPTAEPNGQKLLGPCYVHGAMFGEAIQAWKQGSLQPCPIIFV